MSAKAEGGKKKPPIAIIIGVIVLAIALFGAKTVLGGSKADADEKKPKKSKKKRHEKVGHTLALDEFLVNLQGSGSHYLRTNIALGLEEGVTEEKAKERVAPMRDAILTTLSGKELREVSNMKEREALKEEIKEKVNESLGEDEEEMVVKVYFTSFATQ